MGVGCAPPGLLPVPAPVAVRPVAGAVLPVSVGCADEGASEPLLVADSVGLGALAVLSPELLNFTF
jgi:hypothetical protein